MDKLLQAILRSDLSSFIQKTFYTLLPKQNFSFNWHIDMIADYLTAVENGKIKRLIINLPPRSLKSICISVSWTAWLLGMQSSMKIIVASYSNILSSKHSLDSRIIVSSNWYKKLFPKMILSKLHNQKNKFLTTENGFRFATSVGGSLTGEGGDILIIDDPHNPSHIYSKKLRSKVITWYQNTFATRLNNPGKGAIVIVMQRLHEDDLSGFLLQDKFWTLVEIPAIATRDYSFQINNKTYLFHKDNIIDNNRYNLDYFKKIEDEISKENFAAQYQQQPIRQQEGILSKEYIQHYQEFPKGLQLIVQSWDTAIKTSFNNDFSVCTSWGILNDCYYLLDMFRDKLEYPKLKIKLQTLADKIKPHIILIEDKASGQQLIQDLKLLNKYNIIPQKPIADKINRFASITTFFYQKKVFIPEGSRQNLVFIDEITSFPASSSDDIVDSVSQFFSYVKKLFNKEITIRNII